MKISAKIILASSISMSLGSLFSQDKGVLQEYKPGFYQNDILKDVQSTEVEAKPTFYMYKIDLSGKNLPTNPDYYTKFWHNGEISQGNTGTCWCFSTTSFYESEVKRLANKEVKLSEMYTVYWEYVERAKYFVETRGSMYFGEGSETNAVARMMKMYGAVPYDAYTGKVSGKKHYDHSVMFKELDDYLKSVKAQNAWNTEEVVATTKAILNHYIGVPPTSVKVGNKEMSPKDYLNNELKLNMDNYVNFMSLMDAEYFTKAEYKVPDNWWKSNDYNNVPLDDFMQVFQKALENGFTISVGGDVSEAGFETESQVAVIPSFDIPSDNIDENARYFRFRNNSTTDDHAMHVVGYKKVEGVTWYLVKDSGSGSRNCGKSCDKYGYYFFHEDYIKLKMMTFTVHKDAAKEILNKMK